RMSFTRSYRGMYDTKNDLPTTLRTQMVELLNTRLADAIDLKEQAKQAHWNVKGPNFIALHELFDKVAESADEFVDLLAERTTSLGGPAEGTMQIAAQRSTLPPYPMQIAGWREHVEALASALAAFGTSVREAIDQ